MSVSCYPYIRGDVRMTTEAEKRAIAKYNKANTTQVVIRLNNRTDTDVIRHLKQQESQAGYIKKLIREDMQKK